jgi:hypothetical protein
VFRLWRWQEIAARQRTKGADGLRPRIAMTTRQLRQLLEHVEDTHEIVLRDARPGGMRERDELAAVWSAARAEANLAYAAWRACRGAEAYAVYRAAEDRADSAEIALAAASRSRPGPDRSTPAARRSMG